MAGKKLSDCKPITKKVKGFTNAEAKQVAKAMNGNFAANNKGKKGKK